MTKKDINITNFNDAPTPAPTWAENGDVVRPSDTDILAGWPLTQTPPSRQRFNWILRYNSQGVNHLLQNGIPHWNAAQDYPIGARVLCPTDGNTYVATQANTGRDPSTSNNEWSLWGFSLEQLMAVVRSLGSGAPTGSISYFPSQTPPTGFLPLLGGEYSRSSYGDLWTFANSSGNIVPESDWVQNRGSFSVGDGASTFRLPDLSEYFIRPTSNSRQAGSIQTPNVPDLYLVNPVTLSQNFYLPTSSSPGFDVNGSGAYLTMIANQSPDNSYDYSAMTARNDACHTIGDNELRPQNVSFLACIKT